MPYSVAIPPSTQARLDDLATLLRGCRDAFFAIVDDCRWEQAPGSTAARDATDPIVGVQGVEIVKEVVATYLELAAHQCGALAGLYTTGEVFSGPEPLVRAVMEASARAVWIIGDDPMSAPAVDRLARAYIDNDLSNEEAKKADKWLLGSKSGAYASSKRIFESTRADIEARFSGATDFSKGREVGGQVQESLTGTVTAFFELLRVRGGAGIDPKVGLGIYTLLSNGTHPTLYPLRRRRRPVPTSGTAAGTVLFVDIENLEWLTTVAVLTIYNALSWVHDYCGWSFDPTERFADLIERTLPGFFTSPTT